MVELTLLPPQTDLSPNQQRAFVALLNHHTIADAAKSCDLDEATLYRYLSDRTFKAHYRAARGLILEQAITQLQRDCATAAKTLREICEDHKASASARVAAAKTIIDSAMRAGEFSDLTSRIEEIERARVRSRSTMFSRRVPSSST